MVEAGLVELSGFASFKTGDTNGAWFALTAAGETGGSVCCAVTSIVDFASSIVLLGAASAIGSVEEIGVVFCRFVYSAAIPMAPTLTTANINRFIVVLYLKICGARQSVSIVKQIENIGAYL